MLEQNCQILSTEDTDDIISAEISNINTDEELYDTIKRCMIHGPCGHLNLNCVCMQDGKCSKKYPKRFN